MIDDPVYNQWISPRCLDRSYLDSYLDSYHAMYWWNKDDNGFDDYYHYKAPTGYGSGWGE